MKLNPTIQTVADLNTSTIERMFELMEMHYENIFKSKFEKDLEEKEGVLFLTDEEGLIRGFSTYCFHHIEVDGTEIHAIFSGDTVLDQQAWGTTAPIQILLRLFKQSLKHYPSNLYWFLISKGHRTYLLLPLLFKHFYPSWNHFEKGFESSVIDALASQKFGSSFDREKQLIYEGADCLKETIAFPKRTNKHIKFFLEKNPQFHKGVELPCLAAINEENITPFGMRYFKSI